MEIGDFVAVFTEESNTEPWIAKVEKINEDLVTVRWWEGSYKTRWKASFTRDTQKNRKLIPWIDTIHKNTIILFAFELTTTGILRKSTIGHLKTVYREKRLQLVHQCS